MKNLKIYIAPAIAVLLLVAYWVFVPDADDKPTAPQAKSEVEPPRSPSGTPVPDEEPPNAVPTPKPRSKFTELHRKKQSEMRQKIYKALQPPDDEGKGPANNQAKLAPLGKLDEAYVQRRIDEDLIPLARECYSFALEDDETVSGSLVMKFAIVAEKGVGGVVDYARVAPESEIKHRGLIECMGESLLSVTFAPPRGGGRREVTFPFVFET